MKKLVFGVSLLVLFGLVAAVGPVPGAYAESGDDAAVASWDSLVAADAEAEVDDAAGGRQAPPRLRHPIERLMQSIMKDCPCNGPDGSGWTSHEAFVACVAAKVEVLKDKRLPDAVADRIVARAEASKIGTEGFTCPTRPVPGDVKACLLGAKAVHKSCPCAGPVDQNRAWTNHAEFVTCVNTRVAELQADPGLAQICADRIVAAAEKSPIGTEGFTCPAERREPGQPGDPGRPGKPGPRRP